MITELKLTNFRLFSDEITVRFRPITILIGENNSGKSSIIKFLMTLKQSAEAPGSGFFVTNGNDVQLGRLSEVKNKGSGEENISFSLKVREHNSPSDKVWSYLKKRDLYPGNKKIFYVYQATVNCNQEKQFVGKDHEIIFSAGDEEVIKNTESISPNSSLLRFKKESISKSVMDEQTRFSIEKFCIERLDYNLRELKHLSAIRDELKEEVKIGSSHPRKNVGKRGENTIFELWQEGILTDKTKKDFLLRHTNRVLGIDDITFKELDRTAVCEANNMEIKRKMNISDFGFGVSQCMPIFVQGLLMPPHTHLIAEQPEAQVHPTAQIEMGSFFTDLWEKYKVGSIIETHSANLILRIRHHILRKELKPEDVSIAYITLDKENQNVPVVKNLDIYPDGSLQEGLPREFFGGDLVEMLNKMKGL